jgi:cytochrome c oxidase subunit 2
MLAPAGPSAQAIAEVWWWMLAVAVLVLVGVVGVWLLAMSRSKKRLDAASDSPAASHGQGWIIGGGIVLPTVAITALLVFGSSAGLHQMPVPPSWLAAATARGEPLRIEVIGQQWSWSVHYPGSGVHLGNEMRLPVGRPVLIHVGSRDVIHSFWVPRLGGKLDAIPGRTNVLRLQADQPGIFRGQCAEFCGLSHARMVMTVIAMPDNEFDAWLAAQPAGGPEKTK